MKLLLSLALCQVLSKENRFFWVFYAWCCAKGFYFRIFPAGARLFKTAPPFYRKAFVGFFYEDSSN
jgi:hypothetical protein